MEAAPAESGVGELPFEFKGKTAEYFGIWIVNILLTIVTLGIYTAWAKVRTRRYLYQNTVVAGSNFDYLANPIAILKGWLLAIGALIVYQLAITWVPASQFVFIILFLLALPWLVVRAMIFKTRNTAYRNIRFSFEPAYGEAVRVFGGYLVLVPLTLGLIYPYAVFRQKRFLVDRSGYGSASFSFHGKVGEFYKIYLAVAALVLVLGVLASTTVMPELRDVIHQIQSSQAAQAAPSPDTIKRLFTLEYIILGIYLVGYLLGYSYLHARVTNAIWNNAELDGNRFRSSMRARDLIWLYVSNLVAAVCSVGLLVPWARIRLARYRMSRLALLPLAGIESFVAKAQTDVGAGGEEISDVFDIDIGF